MIYYEPKENLNINNLLGLEEYNKIQELIENSNVSNSQKQFLKLASTRFIRFNYAKIADYYCSIDDTTMKDFIEKLHLVVVDKDSAIKNGYFEYFYGYSKLIEEIVGE